MPVKGSKKLTREQRNRLRLLITTGNDAAPEIHKNNQEFPVRTINTYIQKYRGRPKRKAPAPMDGAKALADAGILTEHQIHARFPDVSIKTIQAWFAAAGRKTVEASAHDKIAAEQMALAYKPGTSTYYSPVEIVDTYPRVTMKRISEAVAKRNEGDQDNAPSGPPVQFSDPRQTLSEDEARSVYASLEPGVRIENGAVTHHHRAWNAYNYAHPLAPESRRAGVYFAAPDEMETLTAPDSNPQAAEAARSFLLGRPEPILMLPIRHDANQITIARLNRVTGEARGADSSPRDRFGAGFGPRALHRAQARAALSKIYERDAYFGRNPDAQFHFFSDEISQSNEADAVLHVLGIGALVQAQRNDRDVPFAPFTRETLRADLSSRYQKAIQSDRAAPAPSAYLGYPESSIVGNERYREVSQASDSEQSDLSSNRDDHGFDPLDLARATEASLRNFAGEPQSGGIRRTAEDAGFDFNPYDQERPPTAPSSGIGSMGMGMRDLNVDSASATWDTNFLADLTDNLAGLSEADPQVRLQSLTWIKSILTNSEKQIALTRLIESPTNNLFTSDDNLAKVRRIAQGADILPALRSDSASREGGKLAVALEMGFVSHCDEFDEGRLYPDFGAGSITTHHFFKTVTNSPSARWELPLISIPDKIAKTQLSDQNGGNYVRALVYKAGGIEVSDPAKLPKIYPFEKTAQGGHLLVRDDFSVTIPYGTDPRLDYINKRDLPNRDTRNGSEQGFIPVELHKDLSCDLAHKDDDIYVGPRHPTAWAGYHAHANALQSITRADDQGARFPGTAGSSFGGTRAPQTYSGDPSPYGRTPMAPPPSAPYAPPPLRPLQSLPPQHLVPDASALPASQMQQLVPYGQPAAPPRRIPSPTSHPAPINRRGGR